MKVGGRLNNSPISFNQKHPIIITSLNLSLTRLRQISISTYSVLDKALLFRFLFSYLFFYSLSLTHINFCSLDDILTKFLRSTDNSSFGLPVQLFWNTFPFSQHFLAVEESCMSLTKSSKLQMFRQKYTDRIRGLITLSVWNRTLSFFKPVLFTSIKRRYQT